MLIEKRSNDELRLTRFHVSVNSYVKEQINISQVTIPIIEPGTSFLLLKHANHYTNQSKLTTPLLSLYPVERSFIQ